MKKKFAEVFRFPYRLPLRVGGGEDGGHQLFFAHLQRPLGDSVEKLALLINSFDLDETIEDEYFHVPVEIGFCVLFHFHATTLDTAETSVNKIFSV